jgi:uncharacterized protein YfbU (UPF0304 family)
MNAQAMTERFEMRLGASVLNDLDSWRAEQEDLPSRAEAVRRLVEAGLNKTSKKRIVLSDGEKLITTMLCQLFKHLNVKSDIDPTFLEAVIDGGHYWALGWEYQNVFHQDEDADTIVSEVVDILDMWRFLERSFGALSKKDKDRVAAEAKPFGDQVVFAGFDGNNESEHCSVAMFLINQLDRFTEFKSRGLDTHTHKLGAYRRMLSVFEPFRINLTGRDLNAPEIVKILQAGAHPSRQN